MSGADSVPHRLVTFLFFALVVFGSTGSLIAAQRVATASIQGKISDNTGGALPGVTVTISGPSLQVPELAAVTSPEGTYRFVNLPPGLYRISYELSGFRAVVREGVRLSAGFAARVDAVMEIGAIEETVTVSAESPVVDVSATTGTTTLTKEILETTPNTRTLWSALAMTPGVRMSGTPDVGGDTVGTQQSFSNYGMTGQITPEVEGIQTREALTGAGMYHDYNAFEELVVRAAGSGPETGTPGVSFIVVTKSGGNDFHGNYSAFGQTKQLQSENIDDALRTQGITRGNPQKQYVDFAGDLGGRIVPDRLWFYGALRKQVNVRDVIGYSRTPGADGIYGTADDELGERRTELTAGTAKVTQRMTDKYQLIGFFMRNLKFDPERGGHRSVPAESTADQRSTQMVVKGEIQGAPRDWVLFNLNVGWHQQNAYFVSHEDLAGKPARYDRFNDRYTGASTHKSPNSRMAESRLRSRPQATASISFFPKDFLDGNHILKFGFGVIHANHGIERPNRNSGNYMLVYDEIAGAPFQPVELLTWNLPILGIGDRHNELYAYANDEWRVSDRVTAQLGLRFERYHNYVVEQEKVQGQFGGSGVFPPVDVLTWRAVAPRFGTAFDLLGDGSTVFKATYGWYNHTAGDTFASNFNQNTRIETRYRWRDPDGNNDYSPGEVDLDPNGRDFISVSGASANILNPDLSQPVTHEATAAVEREIMRDFSVKALYVYRRDVDLYEGVNVLRPYSAYNIPVERRDPGPDGVLGTGDDGGSVTLHDYDAAFRGAGFVGRQFLSRDGKDDSYHTIDVTLNKRLSQNWNMLTSFSATRNHSWIDAIPESPNDEFFPLDETWNWQFKAVGGYEFPYNIRATAFFQHLSGRPGQRTNIFRAVDPDGGLRLRQLSTVTLRLEPLGARREPNLNVLNLRGSKIFDFGGGKRLVIDLDVFNVLNANSASQVEFRSGPTFGLVSQILPPRVARVGATFRF